MSRAMRMARTARALAGAAGLGILAAACGTDQDPGSRIESLRVLAVIADKPYAHPGETVSLAMTYADPPVDDSTSVTIAWGACVNPTDSSVLGCLASLLATAQSSSGADLLTNGTVSVSTSTVGAGLANFEYTVPSDALDGFTDQTRENALVGIVSILCPGTLGYDPDANLSQGQIPITCTDPTTSKVLPLADWQLGMKRIFVRETDRNANPVFDTITWDGQPWDPSYIPEVQACIGYTGNRFDRCDNSLAHHLAANVTAASFETGVDEFGDAFTEQVVIEYYDTEGLFKDDVREAAEPDTQWVARDQSKAQNVTLWMVAHDDRGGTAITQRTVKVD